jgi:hypothetical protein
MKCAKCENSLSFSTDEKGGEIENINLTSASGIISVGGGYSQLAEINATLNIPSMSRALYSKCEDKIRETYRECLSDVISEAGKAEYELGKSEEKSMQMGFLSYAWLPMVHGVRGLIKQNRTQNLE